MTRNAVYGMTATGGCRGPSASPRITGHADCRDGVTSSKATLIWVIARPDRFHGESVTTATGRLVRGYMEGKWVWEHGSGLREEGPYVNGKRHGPWRYSSGGRVSASGSYSNGKRHGDWRFVEGMTGEIGGGSYINGKREGRWIEHGPSFGVIDGKGVAERHEGRYGDGERRGDWKITGLSGQVEYRSY